MYYTAATSAAVAAVLMVRQPTCLGLRKKDGFSKVGLPFFLKLVSVYHI